MRREGGVGTHRASLFLALSAASCGGGGVGWCIDRKHLELRSVPTA